ncbi:MarR family transcriptional regulator [Sulfuricurvum sp.]|uniref:MarR family winged helix-turn-helix transcriptional regulator n=1 Tax=Sulfuricurvum sp. TaxID=2025608 RepID=UPI002D47472C|nr:MarR family transcriptional regulator [Sulfuricurvum sp.]HZF71575.1 MarR family transcriptional regulator [Sulfuricurvum sp.]
MGFESDKSIVFLIAKVRNVLKKEFENVLKPYDLSYAHRVILIRLSEKDDCTQKELAQDTYFEQSNLTLMLDKLETKGLVKRVPKENDRRAYIIKITPEGQKLRDVLIQMGETVMEKALSGVNKKQREELSNVLELIYQNLNS